MGILAMYTSLVGQRLAASIPCPQIWNMIENVHKDSLEAHLAWSRYSMCADSTPTVSGERYGLVYGDFLSSRPEEKVAALHLAFGPAFWVAIWIHVVATEFYLKRNEGKRLQNTLSAGRTERLAKVVGGKGLETL